MLAVALLLAACGGGSDAGPDSVGTLRLLFDGKYGEFYDRLIPEAQAVTSRADFIACQSNSANAVGKIGIEQTETGDGEFTKPDGTKITARYATVKVTATGLLGSDSAIATMWWTNTDGWRLAGIDVPDDDENGCLKAA